ncbi:ATP-binding protein [Sediminimonas sp.]|uniref:ATP-binding protein n=1 Tax=Sediminimonas sp. TaxID=2823379 RepID=UPI0025F21728|nr:ATP-binding protein [Sediminimonas sp.]
MPKRIAHAIAARWKFLLIGLAVAALLVAAGQLLLRVETRLDVLETSQSDSPQWTITQLEVEFLDFQRQIDKARAGDASALEALRRRFDIFYSRVRTMMQSPLYVDLVLAETPRFAEIAATVEAMTALVDAPDARLRAALPEMAAQAAAWRPILRRASVNGNAEAARRAQAAREEMRGLLANLALVLVLLLALLAVLAALFWRQSRINLDRAQANRRIGARLATVIATSPDAIVVTDAAGKVTQMNDAAEHMFGLMQQAATGRPLDDFVRPDGGDPDAPLLPAPGAPEARRHRQARARHADGHDVAVEISVGTPPPGGGEAIRACFLRDITQRIATEDALREARDRAEAADRAKARFLAVMSHEMRTPLNGLLGGVELLRGTPLDAAQAGYADILESSARVLLGHVDDVLDIARIEAGHVALTPGDIDLDALLDEVMRDMTPAAREAGNRLRLMRRPDPLGTIHADAHRVRQILTNLIGNAIKFTRDGRITLEANLAGHGAGREVVFDVSDTGAGIAEGDLGRIFDDFVRIETPGFEHAEGTGLGLGIVRRLAQAMNARVEAESIIGEGSLFRLRLPLPASPAPVATAACAPAPDPCAACRPLDVLIVEDNHVNRFVLRRQIEAEGHRVQEAEDGRAGVAAAMANRFDAILMDLSMPGMDGLQATCAIRASAGPCRDARIVVVTAHVIETDDAACHAAGVDAVITKPVQRAGLLRGLHGTTGSSRAAPQDAPAPVLDAAVIESLRAILSANRVQELLARFRDEGDALLRDRQALAGLDAARASDLAHRLAGAAATLGAPALHQCLEHAVACLGARGDADVAGALEDARRLWPETLGALDRAG